MNEHSGLTDVIGVGVAVVATGLYSMIEKAHQRSVNLLKEDRNDSY